MANHGTQTEQCRYAPHHEQCQQEQGYPRQGARVGQQPGQVQPQPAADEEDRHHEAVPDGGQLGPELWVRRRVGVDQADHRAGEERAEDALQPEQLCQHGEPDE